MNDWLEIDLKTHNGGSHLITNTFAVAVQVRTKNSTIISWIPGKSKNSREKGSKQEYTEKMYRQFKQILAVSTSSAKETTFRKELKVV